MRARARARALSVGFNTPFDPLLHSVLWTAVHIYVSVCVRERGEEVLANPFHSAASYRLIYHSAQKEP